jgi:hypothetical protein
LPKNAGRFAAVHPKRIPRLSPLNSIADGARVRAPAPVQSGDEYLAAVERSAELRYVLDCSGDHAGEE